MMIYLNTIKTIGGLEIKQRYGKQFRYIQRHQSADPISCRYVVYRGENCLKEFRRLVSAVRFCKEAA